MEGLSSQSTEEDLALVDHEAEVVGALLDLRADRPDSVVKPAGGHVGAEQVAGSGGRGGGPRSSVGPRSTRGEFSLDRLPRCQLEQVAADPDPHGPVTAGSGAELNPMVRDGDVNPVVAVAHGEAQFGELVR